MSKKKDDLIDGVEISEVIVDEIRSLPLRGRELKHFKRFFDLKHY